MFFEGRVTRGELGMSHPKTDLWGEIRVCSYPMNETIKKDRRFGVMEPDHSRKNPSQNNAISTIVARVFSLQQFHIGQNKTLLVDGLR